MFLKLALDDCLGVQKIDIVIGALDYEKTAFIKVIQEKVVSIWP